MKKVAIGAKPSKPASADEWVKDRAGVDATLAAEKGESIKRLTIDIDAALHRRLKAECALRGVKIADVVRELLMKEFA